MNDLILILQNNMPDEANNIIVDNFIKAYSYINRSTYKKIICTISGGSDSDLVLDICTKCDVDHKIEYVCFDTGLEYQATKDHLKYLEDKYNITIRRERPKLPVPAACKKVGQPFISKNVSEKIQRLQKHNFKWEDKPFEELYKEYPKCKVGLRWWCNLWGENSKFNIAYNKGLKEFMIQNPPTFKISHRCCDYAKKSILHTYLDSGIYDLNIYGVRRAEGGARSSAYKSCFSTNCNKTDEYRPIWWYKNEDKCLYENIFNIQHSKCYTEYGLCRTGCAGCPFGKDFEEELLTMQKFEPLLFNAANNIFKDSYEYTRKYIEFRSKL